MNNRGIIWAAVSLALALIICAMLVGNTLVKVKGFGNTIRVTGAAYKQITSDYAIWDLSFGTTAPTLEAAYRTIKNDLNTITSYLNERSLNEAQYRINTVSVSRMYNRDGQPTDYRLWQQVRVELDDVERIAQLAKESSSLIERGVELQSSNPQYLFTKLDSLKLEMIEKATRNAKERAERLAETTGREVGAPTSASVGVFQIRPLHSQEVSGMGMNDVTSIEKEIMSTVHVSFLIE